MQKQEQKKQSEAAARDAAKEARFREEIARQEDYIRKHNLPKPKDYVD